MISDPQDGSRPRFLSIKITDEGDEWALDVERNRISPTDEDVCSLLQEFASVLDQLHSEAHTAKALAERLN
jgi:hypothetical protein